MQKKFDYRDTESLRQYLDPQGRIKLRQKTKLTAKEHRQMTTAVKRARHLAML